MLQLTEAEGGAIRSQQFRFLSNPSEPMVESHWKIPLTIVTAVGAEEFLYTDETRAAFDDKITAIVKEGRWVKINRVS